MRMHLQKPRFRRRGQNSVLLAVLFQDTLSALAVFSGAVNAGDFDNTWFSSPSAGVPCDQVEQVGPTSIRLDWDNDVNTGDTYLMTNAPAGVASPASGVIG